MRFVVIYVAMTVTLLCSSTHSQAASENKAVLKPEQVPAECKVIDGTFPVDIQSALLWKKTDMYNSIMPQPVDKRAQSFECQGNKGTIFVFQFNNESERDKAAKFIKPLLWGESGPTAKHPELIIESGDSISVVSFHTAPESILNAIRLETGNK